MIIRMRKYAFMVYHKEYEQFLSILRDLGVVHIKEIKSIADHAELQQTLSERKRVQAVMRSFKKINESGEGVTLAPAKNLTREDGLKLVASIEEMQDRQAQLQAVKQSLWKDMSYMEIWGDFNYMSVNRLKQAGYVIHFFTCPTSKFDPKWRDEYNAILINSYQSVSYFITITEKGTAIDLDAERPKMPEFGLSALQSRYKQLEEDIKQLDQQIQQVAAEDQNTLDEFDRHLQDEFNLAHAMVQTDLRAGDKLMFMEGWTTEDHAEKLEKELDQNSYYFQQLEIKEGDRIPIKLKNNSYSRLFEPITRMFSLPNYSEIDPTALFAPFFMLFFGLCFGDGGYGMLILLACTLLKKKVSPDFKPFLSLFQYLGGMTAIIGILTGSFFGISLAEVAVFSSVKEYFFDDRNNLMKLSIIIGLIHVVFGKTVAAYKTKKQKGTKYSIAPFAWVFTIVALLCAFGLPELNIELPAVVFNICLGIAAVGLLVALLYNTPGKNVFLNFGTGLWNTYNAASGLLGDTLSYIRLFAIGLTGSILGSVFNTLATDMTASMPVIPRIVCMLLILLVGHAINFGLCMISSLVHPLRLIFVEYYKNSEFEGGGKDYLPFKKA